MSSIVMSVVLICPNHSNLCWRFVFVFLLIVISNAGMLSQIRGLELNFGDFELNFGDLNKKREIFRGDRGMPR